MNSRGLDNLAYYRTVPRRPPAAYYDTTGSGNSLNAWVIRSTLQLMLDSLRYWITEMH